MRLTALAHRYLSAAVQAGDLAIDATVGNGHDTCMLAERVGEHGQVIGFDVQGAALEITRARLDKLQLLQRVTLLPIGHQHLDAHLPRQRAKDVAAVAFNLGYLPGSDKQLRTRSETSIQALQQALNALRPHGIITLLIYIGHAEGAEEQRRIDAWLETQPAPPYELIRHAGEAQLSPQLYVIRRMG